MAIYDKPVRLLMKDMANALELDAGKLFTRQQALDWFAHHYPKIKKGTIAAHLIRLSTNAVSRTHYKIKEFEDDVFYQINGSHFRLYDANNDPPPIKKNGVMPTVGPTKPRGGSTEFAYEADLKNYLAKNLMIIEPGLSLYEDEEINGVEFPVGGRFIDILAVDASNNLVVIELKVSRGYDKVVGQLMRYMAWIATNHADAGQDVRGIIVAREISKDLLLACGLLKTVELFEYKLSLALSRVEAATGT